MQHDQGLSRDALGRLPVPQQHQVRHERRLVLRDRDVERWVDRRSTRAAGNDLRRPAKDLLKECPSIVQFEQPIVLWRRLGIKTQCPRRGFRVERRLADRRDAPLAQHIWTHDQPLRLEIVQPFRRFVLT